MECSSLPVQCITLLRASRACGMRVGVCYLGSVGPPPLLSPWQQHIHVALKCKTLGAKMHVALLAESKTLLESSVSMRKCGGFL